MNDITIIYTIKFNVGPYKGKTESIEIELEDLEMDDLAGTLINYDYLEVWCNDNEFEVLSREIK